MDKKPQSTKRAASSQLTPISHNLPASPTKKHATLPPPGKPSSAGERVVPVPAKTSIPSSIKQSAKPTAKSARDKTEPSEDDVWELDAMMAEQASMTEEQIMAKYPYLPKYGDPTKGDDVTTGLERLYKAQGSI